MWDIQSLVFTEEGAHYCRRSEAIEVFISMKEPLTCVCVFSVCIYVANGSECCFVLLLDVVSRIATYRIDFFFFFFFLVMRRNGT